MFDQAAAQRAAQRVIAAAPRIEGGDGSEYVIDVKQLVTEIMIAGQPDAAVIPAYDHVTAASARFWIKLPSQLPGAADPGLYMVFLAHQGGVGVAIYTGDGEHVATGIIGAEFAWHLGMAACSASQEAKRLEDGAEARL